MRLPSVFLSAATLLALTLLPLAGRLAQASQHADIEVLVTAGLAPLPGASVVLDLNASGVWDEDLGEPIQWTDGNGIALLGNVVSIRDPGGGESGAYGDWQPTRIMLGNLRGAVGSREMQVDFVLPAGSGTAGLGLYDLRGRRLARTDGTGDLTLHLPGGLPTGVYFLRLSAEPSAPVSQRITSVGVRTQTIRATRVSAAEAVSAGWTDGPPAGQQKSRKSEDPPHHINLIVAHDHHVAVVQPEVIEPGYNFFTVQMVPEAPAGFVYIPPGTFVMGSPDDEPGRQSSEGPQHEVTLTRGFYMSKYEVTEEQWYEVMGGTPTTFRSPKNYLSWDLAVQFCNALSIQEGLVPAYTIQGPNGNATWDQSANGYRASTRWAGIAVTEADRKVLRRWARSRRTIGVCTTCTVTSVSGPGVVGTRIRVSHRSTL
jgi:hypothetical protein